MSRPLTGRARELHSLIERFLQERRDGKLEKLNPDDPKRAAKRDDLIARFDTDTWIDDAARRVKHIQVATHVIKATHPLAKGATNFLCDPLLLPRHDLVGSRNLNDKFSRDAAIADAKHLDVYGFLKIEFDGRSLLDLMLANDPDLCAALSEDEAKAQAWMQAFTVIVQPRSGPPASHALAKQLYWLVGDDPVNNDAYYLLAPVYASSLAHKVHQTINEHRFGEPAKAARQAKRDGVFSDVAVHDYPQLAAQKLGGTKPQNISQLNSERGGNNYLLASLPPLWVSPDVGPILKADSVFQAFGRREAVRPLIRGLRSYLETDPNQTMETRASRDDWTDQIIDELLQFAGLMQTAVQPGWSASPDCRLPRAQQLWLDPDRALTDEAFATEWKRMDWPQEVCRDFANWLNARIKTDKLLMGDPEFRHWSNEMLDDPKLRWQIDQLQARLKKLEALREELCDES